MSQVLDKKRQLGTSEVNFAFSTSDWTQGAICLLKKILGNNLNIILFLIIWDFPAEVLFFFFPNDSAILFLEIIYIDRYIHEEVICTHIYIDSIHNHEDVESIQMSINRWLVKKIWSIYTTEYESSIKKWNLFFATKLI